jgi:hypothetical protein
MFVQFHERLLSIIVVSSFVYCLKVNCHVNLKMAPVNCKSNSDSFVVRTEFKSSIIKYMAENKVKF